MPKKTKKTTKKDDEKLVVVNTNTVEYHRSAIRECKDLLNGELSKRRDIEIDKQKVATLKQEIRKHKLAIRKIVKG